jgi:hypothetical protein
MHSAHKVPWVYDGQLLNWHICHLFSLAASTARTSAVAMELLVSAGSGKHCYPIRWHPTIAVSTGRHLRSDSSATIALSRIDCSIKKRTRPGPLDDQNSFYELL